MTEADYDLLIIGGGVNGCGIARDAAGRGLKVALVERDDLAAHTSSASTKLIHGGLRYLEQYEFGLVRSSLMEREVLWAMAPHIIWPLRFILPHHKALRPAWLLRLGLFIYDHLGGRKRLPATRTRNLHRSPLAGILKPDFRKGFEYSDCWVEDSRLVALNAVDAAERGADVMVGHEVTGLSRHADHWTATLTSRQAKGNTRPADQTVTARIVVNAAGPWVGRIDGMARFGRNQSQVRLVKGSHIVVRKLYDGDHCYIFQNSDGRIAFAIPYEYDFTLVGTTDVAIDRPEDGKAITDEEVSYLCDLVNGYFARPVTPEDVVWSYSGVRPLYDDGDEAAQNITRDYVLELDEDQAPVIAVYGGKVTTYRKLAEKVLDRLEGHLPPTARRPWTRGVPLPGGTMPGGDFQEFVAHLVRDYHKLPEHYVYRLARGYGTEARDLLGTAADLEDLGRHFGAELYEIEVSYLIRREFAKTADAILWRRTKRGLHMTEEERRAFTIWFDATYGDG